MSAITSSYAADDAARRAVANCEQFIALARRGSVLLRADLPDNPAIHDAVDYFASDEFRDGAARLVEFALPLAFPDRAILRAGVEMAVDDVAARARARRVATAASSFLH